MGWRGRRLLTLCTRAGSPYEPAIRVRLLRTMGKHDVVPDAMVGPCQRYVRPSLVARTPYSAGSLLRGRLVQGEGCARSTARSAERGCTEGTSDEGWRREASNDQGE